MKYLLLVFVVLLYIVLGDYLETMDIITKPASWAFYGYCFGTVIACIVRYILDTE